MLPTMTKEQFEEMSLEELAEWAYENIDYVHHEDTLIEMAKIACIAFSLQSGHS